MRSRRLPRPRPAERVDADPCHGRVAATRGPTWARRRPRAGNVPRSWPLAAVSEPTAPPAEVELAHYAALQRKAGTRIEVAQDLGRVRPRSC